MVTRSMNCEGKAGQEMPKRLWISLMWGANRNTTMASPM